MSGDQPFRSTFGERYSRQVLLPVIGEAGQAKLTAAKVAIIGCGATGTAVAGLLARAGVGTLRIIDRDYVEPSNLQRQMLFDEADAADSLPKAIAAAKKIAQFNSEIVVEPVVADLTPANITEQLADTDLLLDATDNFETRYLVNDYAVKNDVPWIYTAAVPAPWSLTPRPPSGPSGAPASPSAAPASAPGSTASGAAPCTAASSRASSSASCTSRSTCLTRSRRASSRSSGAVRLENTKAAILAKLAELGVKPGKEKR